MGGNLSKPWNPHHIRTSVPIFTPAHLRTWPTLYLYPDDQEGQLGVQSCQQPAGTLKCVQLMWRNPRPPKQVHSDEDVRIRSDRGWYKRGLNALNVEVTKGVPYTHTSNPFYNRQNRVVEQNL